MATQTAVEPTADADVISDAEVEAFRRDGFVLPSAASIRLDSAHGPRRRQVLADNPDWHNLMRMPHVPAQPGPARRRDRRREICSNRHPSPDHRRRACASRAGPDHGAARFSPSRPRSANPTPWHQDTYNPAVKAGEGREFPRSVMKSGSQSIRATPKMAACASGLRPQRPPSEHSVSRRANAMLDFQSRTRRVNFDLAVNSVRAGPVSGHDLFVVHGANANSSAGAAPITFDLDANDVYDRSFGASKAPAAKTSRRRWPIARSGWCSAGSQPDQRFRHRAPRISRTSTRAPRRTGWSSTGC